MKARIKSKEISIDDIEIEAERIANWLKKSEYTSANIQSFFALVLLNIEDINGFEMMGILEESKNTLRESFEGDEE